MVVAPLQFHNGLRALSGREIPRGYWTSVGVWLNFALAIMAPALAEHYVMNALAARAFNCKYGRSIGRLHAKCAVIDKKTVFVGSMNFDPRSDKYNRVLCVDREADLAKKVAQDVGGVACVADVTSREDVERIFATAREAFGGVRGVVDLVGMAKLLPLSKLTDADYEWQFDIGVRHAFLALQIGAPIVAASGGGSFTFVGSISGSACLPNEVVYSASKAALHHLARAAAVELGPSGVRVNTR